MEKILIRMATEADAEALLAIYRPYVEETAVTFEYDTPDVEEFRARIRDVKKKFPYLAAERDGEILGYAYVHPFKERAAYDWAVETSIYVKQGDQGKGVGTMLYQKLEELLKRQHITNLNACITFPNPDSIAFHEKMGYKQAAHFSKCGYKFGQWFDMIWMEKMLCEEHPKTPEPVIPISRMLQSCQVQTLVVGTGAAGLNAAVSLFKHGVKDIALLTEGRLLGTSRNTGSDKQTYYKLTTAGGDGDSVRRMAQTLFDGGSMDGDLAMAEAACSLRGFYHLVDIGVPFPFNEGGEYVGYKTDHDPLWRGTSAGPLTSKFMTEALFQEVDQLGITVLDGLQVIEILTEQGESGSRARGVLALDRKRLAELGSDPDQKEIESAYVLISAENIIYATGGEAGMYEQSVYPASQKGGTGTALRAGVLGKNLTESQYGIASLKFRWNLSGTYQQVLPRYVSTAADGSDEQEFLNAYFPDATALLTAVFRKGYQWPFDPRKTSDFGSSLVDILVYQETVLKGRKVFLDFMHNPSVCQDDEGRFDPAVLGEEACDYLSRSGALQQTPIERLDHMNPAAIELYASHQIDLRTEYLEIAVCAQHNNGGLSGNQWWESNVAHFFPVGEVNGSHGVYRPGGSALNSGQVGSLRAAQYIAACCREQPLTVEEVKERFADQIEAAVGFGQAAVTREGRKFDPKTEKQRLGARMSAAGACIRSAQGAKRALEETKKQLADLENCSVSILDLKEYYRVRDLLVSQITYLSAIIDYIEHGGGSRGSYLVLDEHGKKPLEELPELFRFTLDGEAHSSLVQEVRYTPEGCQCTWRPVRPLPEPETWFENAWRACREGKIYHK